MPVVIETSYSVSIDDSPVWKVNSDLVRNIQGQAFVKLKPYDPALVRMLSHGVIELPKRARATVAQTEGFQSLVAFRNAAALKMAVEGTDAQAEALFGPQNNGEKKRERVNASQLKEMRDNPEPLEVQVPGVQDAPALMITFLRPAHPCDDIAVQFDADTLEHIACFIRDEGFSLDTLTARRHYATEKAGVWRNGSSGIVQKLDDGDKMSEVSEDPGRSRRKARRYKTITGKKRMDAEPEPVGDGEDNLGLGAEAGEAVPIGN